MGESITAADGMSDGMHVADIGACEGFTGFVGGQGHVKSCRQIISLSVGVQQRTVNASQR